MDRNIVNHYNQYLEMRGIKDVRLDGYNEDASSRLAYALAKKEGIDTKGMSPKEVWDALKDKTGKTSSDYYAKSGEQGHDKIRFNTASPKTFTKALEKAKRSQRPEDQWRVTGMSMDELKEWHPNAKIHVTDGGSTIAIDGGDIVGVCKNRDDSLRGSDILQFAVKNGGDRLDSYEGNHVFYVKNGFEPVSWCKWDEQYAPDGWVKGKDKPEDIIFYKYVGKGNVKNTDLDEFKNDYAASKDYDSAYEKRNAEIAIKNHNNRIK